VLDGFKGDSPRLRCLTEGFPEGSFLAPDLRYDGRKVLFAYCRSYPGRDRIANKLDKQAQPEDGFYHVFEMNLDGTGLRQLTHGRYDDTFARYLPNGEIVFLSTRRGTFFQCGKPSAMATTQACLPDSFVRCGGDAYRPVSIYTLHVIDANGANMRAISAFESFEWEPSVSNDGRILYARGTTSIAITCRS
jgi:Tol biopolymer transport system component